MKSLNAASSPTTRAELQVPAGANQANGGSDHGHVNWAFRHQAEEEEGHAPSDSGCRDDDTQPSHQGDVEQGRGLRSDTHSIILDMSTTSFVDTVTVKTLKNVGAWLSGGAPPLSTCSYWRPAAPLLVQSTGPHWVHTDLGLPG